MTYIVKIKQKYADKVSKSFIKDNLGFNGELVNENDGNFYFQNKNNDYIILPHFWIEFMAPDQSKLSSENNF